MQLRREEETAPRNINAAGTEAYVVSFSAGVAERLEETRVFRQRDSLSSSEPESFWGHERPCKRPSADLLPLAQGFFLFHCVTVPHESWPNFEKRS